MVGIGKTLKNKICLSIVRAVGRPTDGFVLNVGYPPGFARVATSRRTYAVNLTARLNTREASVFFLVTHSLKRKMQQLTFTRLLGKFFVTDHRMLVPAI